MRFFGEISEACKEVSMLQGKLMIEYELPSQMNEKIALIRESEKITFLGKCFFVIHK